MLVHPILYSRSLGFSALGVGGLSVGRGRLFDFLQVHLPVLAHFLTANLTPLLALGFLFLLDETHVARVDWLLAGFALVVFSNLLGFWRQSR